MSKSNIMCCVRSKSLLSEQNSGTVDSHLNASYDQSYSYSDDAGRRFQLDSIAEDSIYRDITATGRTYLYKNHAFEYDKNGNMLYENTARKHKNGIFENKTSEIKYRWDEENRLLGISENGYVSTYWYDADGERTVKEHGANLGHYVNSAGVDSLTSTEQFTLYVNPYVVVSNDNKYTNHIYVNGMRVVSKVKDLDLSSFNGNDTHHAGYDMNEEVDYDGKYLDQREALKTNYRELGVPYNGTDHSPYQYFMLINGESGSDAGQQEGNGEAGGETEGGLLRSPSINHQPETDSLTFYYHPDHLRSTTYITDREGNPEQYLSYLPYGEVFIEKSFKDDYATPYKFNGKELDEETGLYYYGARYMHPKYAMWLSTDPLEGKSPDVSSYTFCHNNPIVLIDPAGLDDWDINLQGEIVNRIENTKRDAFFIVDNKGKRLRGKELIFSYGTIERQWKNSFKHKGHYDIYKVRGDNFGKSLFEFFANNTSVEWTHFMLGKSGDQGLNLLITSHQALSEEGGGDMANNVLIKGYTIREHRHNHPSGSDIPSGLPGTILPNGSNGKADIQFASSLNSLLRKRNARAPQYKIYVKNGKYIEYTEFSIPSDFGREPNGTPVIEIGEVEIIGTNKN